jgi:hypothetical protein
LIHWAEGNYFQINAEKIEVIFRKGGKVQNRNSIYYEHLRIKIVNSCKYFGITIQTMGKVIFAI